MKLVKQNFLKPDFLFFGLLIALISMTGCSPVYHMSDFKSKDDFYKKVNEDVQGENVIVRLATSDTSFKAQDAVIENDSIHLTTVKEWRQKKIRKSDIKSVVYYNKSYDNLCASFELLNGEKFTAEYIVSNADYTVDFQYLVSASVTLPIKNLNNISYRNNRGIGAGFGYGLFGGAITGFGLALVAKNQYEHTTPIWGERGNPPPPEFVFIAALVAGPILGTPIGWIIGGRTTWEFEK